MVILAKPKKSYSKNYKTGVIRRQRDNYSNAKGTWKEHSSRVKTLDGRCLQCGVNAKNTPEGYLVVHHIKELSRGGTTRNMNMITLCTSCHSKRHKHL